jgi:hypothetical protein
MDFVFDRIATGPALKCLAIVDDHLVRLLDPSLPSGGCLVALLIGASEKGGALRCVLNESFSW